MDRIVLIDPIRVITTKKYEINNNHLFFVLTKDEEIDNGFCDKGKSKLTVTGTYEKQITLFVEKQNICYYLEKIIKNYVPWDICIVIVPTVVENLVRSFPKNFFYAFDAIFVNYDKYVTEKKYIVEHDIPFEPIFLKKYKKMEIDEKTLDISEIVEKGEKDLEKFVFNMKLSKVPKEKTTFRIQLSHDEIRKIRFILNRWKFAANRIVRHYGYVCRISEI